MMPVFIFQRLFQTGVAAGTALILLLSASVLAQDRASVVTDTYALSYFSERLGGSDLDVVYPVPLGVDPSFWRPDVEEISLMQGADLIILNGAGFSTWTARASLPRSRILNTSRMFRDRYIETETVTHNHGADGQHSHANVASYTWLDQGQALLQANAIANVLAQRGLVNDDRLQSSMQSLAEDLSALHATAKTLESLGQDVVIIATHPRYQYFARAYGLDIRALEWEAGEAPSEQQLSELATLVSETDAGVLIWETVPPDEARQVVRQLGLIDTVFPTLATPPEGADYVASFRQSLEDLSNALSAVDG